MRLSESASRPKSSGAINNKRKTSGSSLTLKPLTKERRCRSGEAAGGSLIGDNRARTLLTTSASSSTNTILTASIHPPVYLGRALSRRLHAAALTGTLFSPPRSPLIPAGQRNSAGKGVAKCTRDRHRTERHIIGHQPEGSMSLDDPVDGLPPDDPKNKVAHDSHSPTADGAHNPERRAVLAGLLAASAASVIS